MFSLFAYPPRVPIYHSKCKEQGERHEETMFHSPDVNVSDDAEDA